MGVLLNRTAEFPASAVDCAGFAAPPAAPAGAGVFSLAAPSADGVAVPPRLNGAELAAGAIAVIVRLAAGGIADLAAVAAAGVSDFAVVVQPPADSRGLSSQLEKLAAAP